MNSKDTRAALLIVKRATGGALTGDMPETPQRNLNSVGLYSKAAELARGLQQPTGTPQQYMAHLAKQGVKPAEFENAGVPGSKKINREDLASHFESAVPNIGVTRLGDGQSIPARPPTEEESARLTELQRNQRRWGLTGTELVELGHLRNIHDSYDNDSYPTGQTKTRYHDYKSAIGGDNYREHLLTLPADGPVENTNKKNYTSSHWEQPNVLAHVRMQDAPGQPEQETINDLREKAGKHNWSEEEFQDGLKKKSPKTLHVDEIQSDWAQDGRKSGFAGAGDQDKFQELTDKLNEKFHELHATGMNGNDIIEHPEYTAIADERHKVSGNSVPDGPYVKNTSHWVDLALKHVLHEASKGDYDKVQFATGQENADRYGLEKKYSSIHYDPVENKLHTIDKNNNHEVYRAKPSELPGYLGDNLSEKLLATVPGPSNDVGHNESIFHELHGDGLVTGGEGMKSFYDKILPKAAMRLIQQHDPDIKPEKIKGSDGVERFGFSFTPRAKRSIMKGQPAFARGGKVEPTDAQKSAGNYKKKHINFQGLPISIENEKGSTRSGQDEKGNKWSVKMPADYGYVKRTEGADGDHVDVYVGPDESSSSVFVIDQKDHRTGRFDEHKVMLGFDSLRSAIQSYTNGFSDGKAHLRLGNVARLSMKEFKQWLSHHDTKKPIRNQSAIDKALSVAKSAQGAKNGI